MKVSVSLAFTEAPAWMGEMVFTRDGDEIVIETVKESGILCTATRVSLVDFNKMADLLLDP